MVALVQAAAPESASDIPAWAKDLTDKREGTTYGPKQYTMLVGVKDHLVTTLINSGGEKSMMDVRLAEKLGFKYHRARGAEFRKFVALGGNIAPYFGLIKGPIPLRFDGDVVITIPCLKLVDHGEALFLIGTDILRGG